MTSLTSVSEETQDIISSFGFENNGLKPDGKSHHHHHHHHSFITEEFNAPITNVNEDSFKEISQNAKVGLFCLFCFKQMAGGSSQLLFRESSFSMFKLHNDHSPVIHDDDDDDVCIVSFRKRARTMKSTWWTSR